MNDVAICLLAGGQATRLPGKLAADAGGVPMLVRVYENVRRGREVWLSLAQPLPPEIDARIDARRVLDRWPQRGPLSGLLSAMNEMRTPWVFACAGDAPFITAALIDELLTHVDDGIEAVVPTRDDARIHIEPLAALYRRDAFLREGIPLLHAGHGALRRVIDQLNARFVRAANDAIFTNVNTPEELAEARRGLR